MDLKELNLLRQIAKDLDEKIKDGSDLDYFGANLILDKFNALVNSAEQDYIKMAKEEEKHYKELNKKYGL